MCVGAGRSINSSSASSIGLSDQVPARVEFLTDGTSRTAKAGPMQIVLKRTTPRQMAAAGRPIRLVIRSRLKPTTPCRMNSWLLTTT
jgi:hypothetical protein